MADPHNDTASGSNLYKAFFDDATLSDLTIRLSDRTVQVHRIVLCRQSEYFTKLITGQFQENGAKEIELKEDDPEDMFALLRHVYDLPYDETFRDQGKLQPYAKVYVVAEKYQVKGLKLAITKDMERIIDSELDLRRSGDEDIDDFLDALNLVVLNTTTHDELARKVMVNACVMNLRYLYLQQKLSPLLRKCADLGAEIIGSPDLECGFQGAWMCTPCCIESNARRRVLCTNCAWDWGTAYTWAQREDCSFLCPTCDSPLKCSECKKDIFWTRGFLANNGRGDSSPF